MPPNPHPGNRSAVLLAATCAALLIAQHVAARACRDALFLSSFPATELPKAMLGAAVVGLVAVLAVTRAMPRLGPGRVVPLAVVSSAGLYALEWALLERFRPVIVVLVYLHASVAGGITVSGFWSVVTERFDPHTTRRIAGYLAAGSALGGLVGGIVARAVGSSQGLRLMLLVLAVAALPAALALRSLASASASLRVPGGGSQRLVAGERYRYLGAMAALVGLIGLGGSIVDYHFKANLALVLPTGSTLVGFFALFYTATSVASVLLQLTLARWVLGLAGLGVALAVLPSALVLLGGLAVASPTPWVFVLLRGVAATLETSLFRSAYEPLYAPLPPQQKRSAKTLIDVACDRLGEAAGSGSILVIASLTNGGSGTAGMATVVVTAMVCVWLALRLERGYVAELAASLRSGRIHLESSEIGDRTTRLALSQTQLEIDRRELLRQIAALRGQSASSSPASQRFDAAGVTAAPAQPVPPAGSARLARIGELLSGNADRIRAALASDLLEPELVSLVIPLLARDDLAPAVLPALRAVAHKIPGQLVDALLTRDLPFLLRQRIPRVLRACPHPRAVRGLTEGLSDPEFEVRYRCAQALFELTAENAQLRPPRRLVLEAASREVAHAHSGPKPCPAGGGSDDEPLGRSPTLGDRCLHHVFTLLGLVLDREALDLALRALSSRDEKLRGTALEYLEHVVPEPIKSGLACRLEDARRPRSAARRPTGELVEELKRSFG